MTYYIIEIEKGIFFGPVQNLQRIGQIAFRRVNEQKEAYSFWRRKFANEVKDEVTGKFPSAKVKRITTKH